MSLTSVDARLDGRRVAADLDRAIEQLAVAERARADAASALADVVGEVDGDGLAQWLGYVSLDRLVAHRSGVGNGPARSLVMVARHLDRFETSAEALRAGRITFAAAEILARTARGLADPYGRDEPQLLEAAEGSEPEELQRICRLWRARADEEAAAADAGRAFSQRGVWMQFGFDGAGHGRFSLNATGAETLWAALDTKPDPAAFLPEPRTGAQRRADKLVDICTASLDGGVDFDSCGTKASIDVVIDIETLASRSGQCCEAETDRRDLAPKVNLERIRSELAHGGLITGPGLERWWCDHHHILPRSRGGPTTVKNLTLLCRFHHTCVHEGGWELSRAPDGTISVRSP
jgi:hypothetical protein